MAEKPQHGGPPAEILAAYNLNDVVSERISAGHINQTWRVSGANGSFALQRLNDIFDPSLHQDIAALVPQVLAAGLQSPALVETAQGALFVQRDDGVWRLLTWIDGSSPLRAEDPARCAAAGLHLGRFHAALWGLEHEFHFQRLGVHDTRAHLHKLETALSAHPTHAHIDDVAPLAEAIFRQADGLDLDQALPSRLVHGDPKISNFVFDRDTGEALCLVDLDTLTHMPLALELGDAFRSWGNPLGEEQGAHFLPKHFAAGFSTYLRGLSERGPSHAEVAAELRPLPQSIARICLELAARFAADALNESYFAWDRQRFARAAAHNLLRTRAQLGLAESVLGQQQALEDLVESALAKA